ncbi:hypothetical protein [Shimia biformata]|uniref:hypothetical protein n=1 Tax=Shimia biformata TaxID=1294299 RepID=UPI001951BA2D|nr:hypothetical protein [Shimia biformata]
MKSVKDIGLHFLVSSPIWLYGAVSAFLVHNSTPQAFQRFGTIAIAVGIVLLGLSAKALLTEIEKRAGVESSSQVPTRYLRFHARELAAAEIFLVVLGTIQTGYGDLLHCWLNGKGWAQC